MIYGYARVSTKEQNLDRQLEEFKKYEIDKVYSEKQSGKDFNSRKVYQTLKKKLVAGDLLIIMSIDRLGRNYQEILDEWRYLVEKKSVDIQVLDMPILNTKSNILGLDGKFISNLVLLIQAYTSEKEREKIKERQAQGIKVAREKGIHLGRPQCKLPDNAEEIIQQYLKREIRYTEATNLLDVSRGTFFRLLKPEEKNNRIQREKVEKIKKEYICYCKNGNVINANSMKILSKKLYCSDNTVRNYLLGKQTLLNDVIDKIDIKENVVYV